MSIKHTCTPVQDVLCQQNCTSFSCFIKNWHYVNSGMTCATSVIVLILNGILFVLLIR